VTVGLNGPTSQWGTYVEEPDLRWGLDTRLITLSCRKPTVANSKKLKRKAIAEKRAVLSIMMMKMKKIKMLMMRMRYSVNTLSNTIS
jgi:hypothetical protein